MSNKSWWQKGGRFKLVWANNTGFWPVHCSLNQVLNQKFRELLNHPVQKDSKHAVLERHREKLQENFSLPLTILLELKVTGAVMMDWMRCYTSWGLWTTSSFFSSHIQRRSRAKTQDSPSVNQLSKLFKKLEVTNLQKHEVVSFLFWKNQTAWNKGWEQ
jgi:hypothetical protein